jgi:hypothetical protein
VGISPGRIPGQKSQIWVAGSRPRAMRAWFTGCSAKMAFERSISDSAKPAPGPTGPRPATSLSVMS